MNMSKEKPPFAIGDRYVSLPGGMDYGIHAVMNPGDMTYLRHSCLRLDERHPCGACEFVVVAMIDPPEDDGA